MKNYASLTAPRLRPPCHCGLTFSGSPVILSSFGYTGAHNYLEIWGLGYGYLHISSDRCYYNYTGQAARLHNLDLNGHYYESFQIMYVTNQEGFLLKGIFILCLIIPGYKYNSRETIKIHEMKVHDRRVVPMVILNSK